MIICLPGDISISVRADWPLGNIQTRPDWVIAGVDAGVLVV